MNRFYLVQTFSASQTQPHTWSSLHTCSLTCSAYSGLLTVLQCIVANLATGAQSSTLSTTHTQLTHSVSFSPSTNSTFTQPHTFSPTPIVIYILTMKIRTEIINSVHRRPQMYWLDMLSHQAHQRNPDLFWIQIWSRAKPSRWSSPSFLSRSSRIETPNDYLWSSFQFFADCSHHSVTDGRTLMFVGWRSEGICIWPQSKYIHPLQAKSLNHWPSCKNV